MYQGISNRTHLRYEHLRIDRLTVNFIDIYYLRSSSMHQTLKESRQRRIASDSRATADRSRIKSERSIPKNSSAREIIIKTEEPDIPLISILKIENYSREQALNGCHFLSRITSQMLMKRLYKGFAQLSKNCHSTKAYLVKVNRLAKVLENRRNRLKNFAWMKLMATRIRTQHKLNATRLLFKNLETCFFNKKRSLFDKVRLGRERRSVTEHRKPPSSKETGSNDGLPYSEEFASVCRTLQRYYAGTYPKQLMTKLDPSLTKEVKRYQQMRGRSTQIPNNEVILIMLGNILLTVKNYDKELEEKIKMIESKGIDVAFDYQKIEADFEKYDLEIRKSL